MFRMIAAASALLLAACQANVPGSNTAEGNNATTADVAASPLACHHRPVLTRQPLRDRNVPSMGVPR